MAQMYKDESWLRNHYQEKNMTLQEIASITEVSHITIYNWLINFDIPRRKPGRKSRCPHAKPGRNRAVVEMYNDGYPSGAVAEAFGISRERVRQLLIENDPNYCAHRSTNKPIIKHKQRPKSIHFFLRNIYVGDDCWEWQRYVDHGGYGRIRYNGKSFYTHQYSWIIFNGAIPPGMHVLHHCDNPSCVNPNHLYIGTHQDNMRDREARNSA